MRHPSAVTVCLLLAASAAHGQTVCGYVATNPKPPASKDLYPAAIAEVDGKKVAGSDARRIKLEVGVHRIGVQAQIGDDRRGRAKLVELGIGDAAAALAVIEIDVQADSSYQIAAQLVANQKDRAQPGGYWEPVVWRKLVDSCR